MIKHAPKFPHFPWWRNLHQGAPRPLSALPGTEPKGGLHSDVFSVSHWNLWAAWEHRFSWIHRGSLKLEAGSLGPGMFANTFDCIVDNRDFISNKAGILGSSSVVQWLRLCVPNSRSMGSIPSEGTKIPHTTGRSQSKGCPWPNHQQRKSLRHSAFHHLILPRICITFFFLNF